MDYEVPQGYKEFTIEKAKEMNGQKLLLLTLKEWDWMTIRKEMIYKIFVNDEGKVWLMPPRARKKGYMFNFFDGVFVRI